MLHWSNSSVSIVQLRTLTLNQKAKILVRAQRRTWKELMKCFNEEDLAYFEDDEDS